jgi:hypothetical protein
MVARLRRDLLLIRRTKQCNSSLRKDDAFENQVHSYKQKKWHYMLYQSLGAILIAPKSTKALLHERSSLILSMKQRFQ